MGNSTKYLVNAAIIGRTGTIKTIAKSFSSEAARSRWIESQKTKGTLHDVYGFSTEN